MEVKNYREKTNKIRYKYLILRCLIIILLILIFKLDRCDYCDYVEYFGNGYWYMDEETECCIMKDLMTSCRIIGVVDSVKAGSVLIKILEFDNSFHFFPKEYRPKFMFVKSGSHEYLDINACKSELEYLDSGMPVEKLAGKDYVQIGTVCISLFNDRNNEL